MTPDEIRTLTESVARRVVELLLDDRRHKRMTNEMVLRVLVDQERQRQAGVVRSFLQACDARRVHLRMNDKGRVVGNWRQMSAELRAVYIAERESIMAHLEQVRRLERNGR